MEQEAGMEKGYESLVAEKLSKILGLQRRVRHNLAEVEDISSERDALIKELEQIQGNLSERERRDFLESGEGFEDWMREMEQDWEGILKGERTYEKIDIKREKRN